VALEDKESWLNLNESRRKVYYAVVDGQIGERTTVAFGHTHQENDSTGVMWGALPLLYTDGTQAEFDVSATTSMSWTYWNIRTDSSFAEVAVQLSADWQVKSVLTYNSVNEPSELFWTYPSAIDRQTGLGMNGWPGSFEQNSHALLSDTSLSGTFALGGRSHEATLGLSLSESHGRYYDYAAPDDDPSRAEMPAFPGWTGTEVPRPEFGDLASPGHSRPGARRIDAVAG
jgi:outer membrane receptor for ferric coprogen and ferric-rhodotorulic acid